jgi:type IV pilus assembly protein PilN
MIRVNLVKAEKKEIEESILPEEHAPKEKKKAPLGNLLIALAVVVVGALAYVQKTALDTERALLEEARAEKLKLQPVGAKLDLVEQQKIFLEKKIGLINGLKARQSGAVRIMEEISRDLPDWVWLTEANLRPQGLELKGRALSNIQVSDFMRNLEKSGLYDNVGLVGSIQRTMGTNSFLEFTLTAAVAAPAPPPGPVVKGAPAPEAR